MNTSSAEPTRTDLIRGLWARDHRSFVAIEKQLMADAVLAEKLDAIETNWSNEVRVMEAKAARIAELETRNAVLEQREAMTKKQLQREIRTLRLNYRRLVRELARLAQQEKRPC